ncbi:MAG: rRNA adenine N-6-methyltransferase family protein [Kyrpidia sp.]|nr:rRNA adenine N-6-methyltransferase family protein [Kyrpidia sp.]
MEKRLFFLQRFLANPRLIGSVAPSSRFLCEQMMRCVPWEQTDRVVELGAGIGVMTRDIFRRKHPDARVLVFEKDPELRRHLAGRYPEQFLFREAAELARVVEQQGLYPVDAIVSGLPFAVFPAEARDCILDQVWEVLRPGGVFVTFQYSLQLKRHLQQRFRTLSIEFTPWNLPPAFVYRCEK